MCSWAAAVPHYTDLNSPLTLSVTSLEEAPATSSCRGIEDQGSSFTGTQTVGWEKKKKNLISWKKNHLPNCHVSGSQLLSITITFCLSRKNAFHSERDLFIRENNRDKSINVWVFINSGIKPFGITCEATSYRSQWGKASYTLVKGTLSIHFCLTLEHNKIQIPNLGWISIIQPPVSHNSSSCSGWVVVETKKWCTGTWFSDLTNYVIGYMLSSILRLFF